MSRQYSDNFEAGLGSGKTSFVHPTNGAMMVSASSRFTGPSQLHNIQFNGFAPCLIAGGEEIPVPEEHKAPKADRSSAFDRWPFMKTREEESLHDRISGRVLEALEPSVCRELTKQLLAYKTAFQTWSQAIGTEAQPPELKDYPLIQEHNQQVQNIERSIVHAVFANLTKDETVKLDREFDPQGYGFAPKTMTDEVVKRIREQTRVYLNSTEAASSCTDKFSNASTTGL
jgi:hypothetical protein